MLYSERQVVDNPISICIIIDTTSSLKMPMIKCLIGDFFTWSVLLFILNVILTHVKNKKFNSILYADFLGQMTSGGNYMTQGAVKKEKSG